MLRRTIVELLITILFLIVSTLIWFSANYTSINAESILVLIIFSVLVWWRASSFVDYFSNAPSIFSRVFNWGSPQAQLKHINDRLSDSAKHILEVLVKQSIQDAERKTEHVGSVTVSALQSHYSSEATMLADLKTLLDKGLVVHTDANAKTSLKLTEAGMEWYVRNGDFDF